MEVEKELVKATKFQVPVGKPRTGAPRQEYLSKLAGAADDLDDEAWDALSKGARDWVRKALSEDDKGSKITDFASEESAGASSEEEVKKVVTKRKAKTRTVKRKRPSTKPKKEAPVVKAKTKAKAKVKTKARTSKVSKTHLNGNAASVMMCVISDAIAKGKEITKDDIQEEARKAGHDLTPYYVATFFSNFRRDLKFIRDYPSAREIVVKRKPV